jgi:hypothetical protein
VALSVQFKTLLLGFELFCAITVAAYDFSKLANIVDVGGATGNLLSTVLAKNPQSRGILYDLPHVVSDAPALLEAKGCADRVTIESGSFFERVPSGGDAYLLSNPLFVGVDEVDKRLDVFAMSKAGLFFPHFEPRLHFGVALFWITQHRFSMSRFHRVGLFHMAHHPIADLTIANSASNNFDELFGIHSGRVQPFAIKPLAEIGLVIGVQFSGQMKTDFIDEPGQVHPATHGFARAPRVGDVAHGRDDWAGKPICQWG